MKKFCKFSMLAAAFSAMLTFAGCCGSCSDACRDADHKHCGMKKHEKMCETGHRCAKKHCPKRRCITDKCSDKAMCDAMMKKVRKDGHKCTCLGCATGAEQCKSSDGKCCDVCGFFGCTKIKPDPKAKDSCCYLIVEEDVLVPAGPEKAAVPASRPESKASAAPVMVAPAEKAAVPAAK